ncbi:MAG: ThiF family adenylyltransferase [Clostridia bacterium]
MESFSERTVLLIGETAYARLQNSRVVVAGLGGVGGHCAEALARAGVGWLHLVDNDTVNTSNLNRQLVATKHTIGMRKTDAMAERIRDVSNCEVTTCDRWIDAGSVGQIIPAHTDFLVDAIDSTAGKVALIGYAQAHQIPIVSCMGAGNRLDAGQFQVIDLYQTKNCPLARRMRQELRKVGIAALPVVCSSETACTQKNQATIGSLAPVTATAGLRAANYVILELLKK